MNLMVGWYDTGGDLHYEYITRSFLSDEFRVLSAQFTLPAGAKLAGPLFRVLAPEFSNDTRGLSYLVLDEARIDKGTPIDPAPERRPG